VEPERRPSALERARADRARGRPDLARDRVTGYLAALHARGVYEQEAYLLLGEIHAEMRDYARAGAAWLLTERHDALAEAAFDAFRTRYGDDPVNILQALKPRAPIEAYPQTVVERLQALKYRYRKPGEKHLAEADAEQQKDLRGRDMGCVVFLAAMLGLLLYFVFLVVRANWR
jgi:hypothetical protein